MEPPERVEKIQHAGFWGRAIPAIVDGILVNVLALVSGVVVFALIVIYAGIITPDITPQEAEYMARHVTPQEPDSYLDMTPRQIAENIALPLGWIAGLGAGWLYFALFESSGYMGTPGKRMLGLKVTDLEGEQVSFSRATARHFGKFVSLISLLIGYLMAGWTKKKQALHDLMAGCLVVKE